MICGVTERNDKIHIAANHTSNVFLFILGLNGFRIAKQRCIAIDVTVAILIMKVAVIIGYTNLQTKAEA